MADNALETLRLIFQDQPDLLKIIELGDIESRELVGTFRKNNELFAAPINLYVTGRTGAGKTSLGNCLLEEVEMKSTGHIDCTDSVGYFKLASNLCYFDLPGSGSNDKYENINRAVLLMPQIPDKYVDISIQKFKLIDYSNGENSKTEQIQVEKWQSNDKQKEVQPDIILYVIAPHMQFIRSDREYLGDLLETQKASNKNQVIFAINIFRNEQTGEVKHTPQNIEDVENILTNYFQQIYQTDDNPPIFTFDAKTGSGLNEITSYICQILPKEKLGNIQQVLRGNLKELAQQERIIRYEKALIRIASRLATYKVDQKAGNQDLIKVAASAVCTYGVETFKNPEKIAQIQAELSQIIENTATLVKESQAKDIIVPKNITELKELIKEIPIIEEKRVTDYIETNKVTVEELNGFQKITNTFTKSIFGFKFFEEEIFNEKVRQPIERLETRFLGYEKQVIDTIEVVVGQVEEVVGKNYLQGGYPVIKLILALGKGVRTYCSNSQNSLQVCIKDAEVYYEYKLAHIKVEIEKFTDNPSAQDIEQKLIYILERELL